MHFTSIILHTIQKIMESNHVMIDTTLRLFHYINDQYTQRTDTATWTLKPATWTLKPHCINFWIPIPLRIFKRTDTATWTLKPHCINSWISIPLRIFKIKDSATWTLKPHCINSWIPITLRIFKINSYLTLNNFSFLFHVLHFIHELQQIYRLQ